MLNSKNFLRILVILLWLSSCKSSSVVFKYEKNVNLDFFKNVTGILPDIVSKDIDSIKVYRARLTEKLVERDAIPDYKLINSASKQKTVPLLVSKNYHYLYLMQIYTKPQEDQDTLFVFLSTSFTPDGLCTGLGPAYLGYIFLNELGIERELKIKKVKEAFSLEDKGRFKMNIISQATFPAPENVTDSIRIQKIILLEHNKISGDKPVVYTTKKIFDDDDALLFRYFGMIRK